MNSTATDRKIKIIPPKANMNTEKKKKVKKNQCCRLLQSQYRTGGLGNQL